jgi:hypothetical protein
VKKKTSREAVHLARGRRRLGSVAALGLLVLACGSTHHKRATPPPDAAAAGDTGSGGSSGTSASGRGGKGGGSGSGTHGGTSGSGTANRGGTTGGSTTGGGATGGGATGGTAGSSSDAGASGDTGGTGNAGSAGSGGTGASPGEAGQINSPDVPVVNAGGDIAVDGGTEDSAQWIRVRGSRYYVASPPGQKPVEEHWLALIENIGSGIVCNVGMQAELHDAQGQVLAELLGATVYAETYTTPALNRPLYCFGPGEVGVGVAARSAASAVDLDSVAGIRFTAAGSVYSDAERKAWATLEFSVEDVSGGQVVHGTLLNGDTSLGWWAAHVFSKDDNGIPSAEFDASDPELGVDPGATFTFDTTPFALPVAGYYTFIEHGNPQ